MPRPSTMTSLAWATLILLGCSDEPIGAPIDDDWFGLTDAGATTQPERDDVAETRDEASAASDDASAGEAGVQKPGDAGTVVLDGGLVAVIDKGSLGPDGGTLSTEDGSAMLVVPKGALSADTELTLQRVLPPPGGALMAVELGPVTAEFELPVTLTLSYAEFDLTQDPARLVMARQDSNGWSQFSDAVHSLQARTLSLALYEPAIYGVLVGPEIVIEPEPEPVLDAGTNTDPTCSGDCAESSSTATVAGSDASVANLPDSGTP